jgi:hypothetical protein
MSYEKLPILEGSKPLAMENLIAVGFGDAWLSRDGEVIWREGPAYIEEESDIMTVGQAEELAAKDPDHDWRIHYYGPLSEEYFQRQGEGMWVRYAKGRGFA